MFPFSVSKGLVGVGLNRKSFEFWRDHNSAARMTHGV
jgi:hypothetical protein